MSLQTRGDWIQNRCSSFIFANSTTEEIKYVFFGVDDAMIGSQDNKDLGRR